MAHSLFPRFGTFFDDIDAFGSVGPAVHVRESHDALILELEVPRYHAEELKVEQQGQNLVISGNHSTSSEHHAYNQFLYGEAPMSQFRRTVFVPPTWDLSKVDHELNYGVLQIRIPRAPESPQRRLEARPQQQQQQLQHQPQAQQQQLQQQQSQPQQKQLKQQQQQHEPEHLNVRDTQVATQNNGSTQVANPDLNDSVNFKWPPKIKVDDTNDHITYTAKIPPTVDKSHIDLSLDGQHLDLGVHHRRNVVKKDQQGNVVYSQDQSVSYSTNLYVPDGTTASDISTNYNDGQLTINVTKHQSPSQQVPVKKLR